MQIYSRELFVAFLDEKIMQKLEDAFLFVFIWFFLNRIHDDNEMGRKM